MDDREEIESFQNALISSKQHKHKGETVLILPFLICLAQSSKTISMYTKGPFLSNIVHKFV